MPNTSPNQLFDGANFENSHQFIAADAMKSAAPQNEWPIFDWDEFARLYKEVLPADLVKPHQIGAQRFGVQAMPARLVAHLIKQFPTKTLWAFLKTDHFALLRYNALKGFQQTPAQLRNPVVQARLLHHLEEKRADLHALLLFWAAQNPKPAVLENDSKSEELAPAIQRFGVLSVWLASVYFGQIEAAKFLQELQENPDILAELLASSETSESNDQSGSEPTPDSLAAKFWHERAQIFASQLQSAQEKLEKGAKGEAEFALLQKRLVQIQKDLVEARRHEQTVEGRWEKKLSHLDKKLNDELSELRRHDERQSRRLKAVERERDELETDNRRLKKQLRHVQQLLEETRKKVPTPEEKAETTPEPIKEISTPQTSRDLKTQTVKVGIPTPLDEIFEWEADGRRVRVTAREVRRRIDQNDEDAVFSLMLALEALEIKNRDLYFKVLHRIKTMGNYYSEVLTKATTRVLVDASNVARSETDRRGRGQIAHLFTLRDELRRRGCWPIIFIADASLPYNLDNGAQLREMAKTGEMILAPAGTEADELLTREARRTGAFVVTNDQRFHFKVSPDFEPPRISFRVYDGVVIIDEF